MNKNRMMRPTAWGERAKGREAHIHPGGCALKAGARQVLLIFKKGASVAIQSPHDGAGALHLAFAIPASELDRWETWLADAESNQWGDHPAWTQRLVHEVAFYQGLGL